MRPPPSHVRACAERRRRAPPAGGAGSHGGRRPPQPVPAPLSDPAGPRGLPGLTLPQPVSRDGSRTSLETSPASSRAVCAAAAGPSAAVSLGGHAPPQAAWGGMSSVAGHTHPGAQQAPAAFSAAPGALGSSCCRTWLFPVVELHEDPVSPSSLQPAQGP